MGGGISLVLEDKPHKYFIMKSKITSVLKIVFLFAFLIGFINCETDSERETEHIEQIEEEIIDFSKQPNIETVTLNQLNKDSKFNEIKNNFGILKNSALSNSGKDDSYATRLVDSLGITIAPNTIQKITHINYVSYTMLMIEPDDTSINFSNLVIQESDGVKKIFTARYFPDQQNAAKNSNSASKSGMNSFNGDMQLRSGVRTPNDFQQDGTGGGSSGGNEDGGSGDCEEYETICKNVGVYVAYACGCGHMPWDDCKGCNGNSPFRPGFTYEIKRECFDVCKSNGTADDQSNANGANGSNGNTSGGENNENAPSDPDIITGLVFPDAEMQQKANDFIETLNIDEKTYINDFSNGLIKANVLSYLARNNFSEEAKDFAKEAIKVHKESTTPEEKAVVSALLNGDLDTATDILLEGATFTNSQCPPDCNDVYFDAPVDLTASIIIGTSDGVNNTLLLLEEFFVGGFEFHRQGRGEMISQIMKESGIDIPNDVDLLILDRLFKLRMRGAQMVVEQANDNIFDLFNDLTISLLDLASIISPSKGGSAYLFVKTGGNITVKALADYLKLISVTTSKIDGLINNLKTTAKYELNGTGAYKNVSGHHPLAKKAFEGDELYKYRDAFSVSINALEDAWKTINNGIPQNLHSKITGQQNSLYSAFAQTGERLTLGKMAEIEIKAMTNAGIPLDIAQGWVIKALENLKTQGVKLIINIPWNGKN